MDGSQKIPQRWLETLVSRQHAGQQCPATQRAIAAWIVHLRGQNGAVGDPLAAGLFAAATGAQPVQALFGQDDLLASS
jgi:fructuronate reductase